MPMYCCPTQTDERKISKGIDKDIQRGRKKFDAEIKLLLLGAGDSGKSTLAKQMKIIHLRGFTDQERLGYRPTIMNNIVVNMKTLVRECLAKEASPSSSSSQERLSQKDAAERVSRIPDTTRVITREIGKDIKDLWADPAIQQTHKNASVFYIMDNIKYYFDDVDRITAEGYVPNDEDVLKSRATTTGIYETEFFVQDAHFKMIDVGGQRTERKKWIHCFEGVTAVLFCASLSEYDQLLLEDDETMRMHESLNLFGEVCQSPWFADTAMILFLNKDDLFKEKITRIPLTTCFPEYTGPNLYEPAREYIHSKFVGMVDPNTSRNIYHHFTTATNTQNINVVFDAVRDIVLRIQLQKNGMI